MFKKYSICLVTLLLLCDLPEYIFAQTQDPITLYQEVYEGNKTINVDQCDNYANYANRLSFGERDGSTFRFARFWISFGDGCKYDLTNGDGGCGFLSGSWQNNFQLYWNKVMKISTDQWSNGANPFTAGDKNSIRLGWRYVRAKDVTLYPNKYTADNANKIELGFYAHLDHLGEDAGDQGREFKSLGVFYSY